MAGRLSAIMSRLTTRRWCYTTSSPLGEVKSLATTETNWIVTAAVLAPIVFVGVLFFWLLLDSPGGGMEGTSD